MRCRFKIIYVPPVFDGKDLPGTRQSSATGSTAQPAQDGGASSELTRTMVVISGDLSRVHAQKAVSFSPRLL
jgi:hypothetical protein